MKQETQSYIMLFIIVFLAIILANITTSTFRYIYHAGQMNAMYGSMNMGEMGNMNDMGTMGCPMMKQMMEGGNMNTGKGMCGNSGSGSSSGMCGMGNTMIDMKTMTGNKN